MAVENAASSVGSVGGVDAGNKANGVSDAVGVGAGDTTSSSRLRREYASYLHQPFKAFPW